MRDSACQESRMRGAHNISLGAEDHYAVRLLCAALLRLDLSAAVYGSPDTKSRTVLAYALPRGTEIICAHYGIFGVGRRAEGGRRRAAIRKAE